MGLLITNDRWVELQLPIDPRSEAADALRRLHLEFVFDLKPYDFYMMKKSEYLACVFDMGDPIHDIHNLDSRNLGGVFFTTGKIIHVKPNSILVEAFSFESQEKVFFWGHNFRKWMISLNEPVSVEGVVEGS